MTITYTRIVKYFKLSSLNIYECTELLPYSIISYQRTCVLFFSAESDVPVAIIATCSAVGAVIILVLFGVLIIKIRYVVMNNCFIVCIFVCLSDIMSNFDCVCQLMRCSIPQHFFVRYLNYQHFLRNNAYNLKLMSKELRCGIEILVACTGDFQIMDQHTPNNASINKSKKRKKKTF